MKLNNLKEDLKEIKSNVKDIKSDLKILKLDPDYKSYCTACNKITLKDPKQDDACVPCMKVEVCSACNNENKELYWQMVKDNWVCASCYQRAK